MAVAGRDGQHATLPVVRTKKSIYKCFRKESNKHILKNIVNNFYRNHFCVAWKSPK